MLTAAVASVEDACDYLGIDEPDELVTRRVASTVAAAVHYVNSTASKNIDDDNPLAKELVLIVVGDLYDQRGLESGKAGASVRRFIESATLVLDLEGREK